MTRSQFSPRFLESPTFSRKSRQKAFCEAPLRLNRFRSGFGEESARFFRGLGRGQAENAKTFHISLAHCGICFKTRSAIPGWRSWFVCFLGVGALFVFFPAMERTKDRRGWAPRSASTPVANPRTPLRGTHPGRLYYNAGAGGAADCPRFRAAAAGLGKGRGRSGWTENARRLPAAVEVGQLSRADEDIRPYTIISKIPTIWGKTEAKRSFAQSSLLSFLSRKRAGAVEFSAFPTKKRPFFCGKGSQTLGPQYGILSL